MEVKVNRIDDQNVEMSFTVDKAEIDKALNKVYSKIANDQEIKGFRKGKVPRDVIRGMVGAAYISQLALDDVLPDVYSEACEKANVVPIDHPTFDPVPTIVEGEAMDVSLKVQVLPEYELPDYSAIPVDVDRELKIEEEEIEKTLENIKSSVSDYVPLVEDRGVQETDRVVIDYAIKQVEADGTEVETDKKEDQSVVVGQGDTLPEIESNIIGMKINEENTFDIDFPEDYPREEIAGKKAIYSINLKSVERRVEPESDEELLEKLGGEIDSMEKLIEQIKLSIEHQKHEVNDQTVTVAVVSHVVEGTAFEAPDPMIQDEISDRFSDLENMLAANGKTLDDFAATRGISVDELRQQEYPNASSTVKRRIIFNRIFTEENLEISKVEIERAVARFASENQLKASQIKKLMKNPGFLGTIRQRLREAKVAEFLKTKVVYKDDPEFEKVKAADNNEEKKAAPAAEKKTVKAKKTKKAEAAEGSDKEE